MPLSAAEHLLQTGREWMLGQVRGQDPVTVTCLPAFPILAIVWPLLSFLLICSSNTPVISTLPCLFYSSTSSFVGLYVQADMAGCAS